MIKRIERLLKKEEYTDGATRCVIVIEQALRQVFRQYLPELDEEVKHKVQKAVQKRGKKNFPETGILFGTPIPGPSAPG